MIGVSERKEKRKKAAHAHRRGPPADAERRRPTDRPSIK